MRSVCHVHQLGLVPYQEAWDLQNQLAEQIHVGDRPPTLLLLEHPHTYTFGRSGDAKNLLWNESVLAEKGIEVHWVDRGGDITYHGPGQLVGYPLLPLGVPVTQTGQASNHLLRADYIGYLRKLEDVIISTLRSFGLKGEQHPGMTGVWLSASRNPGLAELNQTPGARPVKVASIGVKVDSHGISRHGFALNVEPDMSYWNGIIACGLEGYGETSLAEVLPTKPGLKEVIERLVAAFGETFDYKMSARPIQDLGKKI
jgi:lipoyl(octanoyl) transferase